MNTDETTEKTVTDEVIETTDMSDVVDADEEVTVC